MNDPLEMVRIDGVKLPIDDGPFELDEKDFLLYGMLLDPVYMPELCWRDPENFDYAGQYRVRDYQYIINRLDDCYAIVSCARKVGKALASDEPVLTPTGWRPIGELAAGEMVIGSDGSPTAVLGVYPQGIRPLFEVEFTDETRVRCDADHLWYVTCDTWNDPKRRGVRGPRLRTTAQLAASKMRYKVPPSAPVQLPTTPLPIPPWLLGCLLGDGSFTSRSTIGFSAAELEIADRVGSELASSGVGELCHDRGIYYYIRGPGQRAGGRSKPPKLLAQCRAWGLHPATSSDLFIPDEYLWASLEDRLELLRGLVDADGTVTHGGGIEVSVASRRLAEGVRHLVLSLGGRARIRQGRAGYRTAEGYVACKDRHRVTCSFPEWITPCWLPRKVERYKERYARRVRDTGWRGIRSITPIASGDATCIAVAARDGLFLTRDFVLTHNTESEKVHAEIHPLKSYGKMLITAPELIHLLPLTDAIEDNIADSRPLYEFLDMRNGQTGFQHRPFQCVAEGELVLTARGHVPIEEVNVGDMVLTHRCRWRPVTARWERGEQDIVEIRPTGSAGLRVTPDHRLYARRVRQRQHTGKTGKRVMRRESQPSEWIGPDRWRTTEPATRAALPARVAAVTPPEPFRLNRSGFGVGRGTLMEPTAAGFLWLLGLYLAEGCTWRDKLTVWSIHKDEVEVVVGRMSRLGIPCSTAVNTGAGRDVRVTNAALARFFAEQVPAGARRKDIPTWVFGLSDEQRMAVWEGLMFGDGHLRPDGSWHGSFASRPLCQALGVLSHSLGFAFGTGRIEAKDHQINGHAVESGPQWAFYVNPRIVTSHVHVRFDAGLAWTAATRICEAGRARVFDLTVEEDHSFVASGVVVSNCNFSDGTKIVGRIPQRDGRGVKGQHEDQLLVEEGQDYPEAGWVEIQETVNYDARDRWGEPKFRFWIYGVHSGNKSSGFDERARSSVYKKIKVTALRRPDWTPQRKQAALAAYGGSSSPDYRRNILGEPGAGVTAYFVAARVMACVDQQVTRGEKKGSDYNDRIYVAQKFRAEELDEIGLNIGELLDLPRMETRGWWGGVDIGLTDSPTVISLFAELERQKRRRLALVRRITLERFRPKQIREALYAIGWHFGQELLGVGVDVTGLGKPIFQDMEDDELCPPRLRAVTVGYTFNSNVEVGIAPDLVTEENGVLRDHLGNMVKVVEDPLTGEKNYIVMRPFIAAATDFIRGDVDDGTLLLPFDTDVTSDMLQETKQRVERVGRRGETQLGRAKKGDRFHILDSFRAMAYRRQQDRILAAIAPGTPDNVLECTIDDIHVPTLDEIASVMGGAS